jgi:hypothetical protein
MFLFTFYHVGKKNPERKWTFPDKNLHALVKQERIKIPDQVDKAKNYDFFKDTFLFVLVGPVVRIRIRLVYSASATRDRSDVAARPRQADFLTRCWRGQSSQSSWSCPSAPSCRPQNSPRHPGPPVRVGLFSHY